MQRIIHIRNVDSQLNYTYRVSLARRVKANTRPRRAGVICKAHLFHELQIQFRNSAFRRGHYGFTLTKSSHFMEPRVSGDFPSNWCIRLFVFFPSLENQLCLACFISSSTGLLFVMENPEKNPFFFLSSGLEAKSNEWFGRDLSFFSALIPWDCT